MKARIKAIVIVIAAAMAVQTSSAQIKSFMESVTLGEHNLGGPRLGVTYVSTGVLTDKMKVKNIGQILSQFGWHFEYQVVPEGGGPSFIIQFVPLVAGVEYGTLIPSATLAMGVRFPEGFEFGLGPNALITDEGIATSLVMAIGKSFNYGGVSIPINLVVATNPSGVRTSIIFGYSVQKPNK